MKKEIFILAVILSIVSGTFARASDVCEKSILESLQTAIKEKFPSYRIASSSDQCTKDDNDWNRLYCKSNKCQTVASGDFDGNNQMDYALYLVKQDSEKPALIVALRKGGNWKINELRQWNESILGCYVAALKPGLYKHTMSYDFDPYDSDQREKIEVKRTSIMAGLIEATGVAYVYDEGRWLYVWVSD